mgnify:FL=1
MQHAFSRLLIASLGLSPLSANADFKNASYSYFSIGSERTTYSESLPSFAGSSFESDFTGSGITQRSGGYTSIGEDSPFGFIIATQSTLLSDGDNESWDANWDSDNNGTKDGAITVMTDTVNLNQANLDLLGVFHFRNGLFVSAGMHYQKISFSRYDFNSTDDTPSFSDFTLANSTAFQNILQEIADNGSYTYSNGTQVTTAEDAADQSRFNPEAQTPVVSEDITAFNLVAGIGYDSFFLMKGEGLRYKFNINLGTPAYLHLINTNLEGADRSLSESFPGGVDLNANGAIGYQLNEKLGVLASLSYSYVDRDSISITNNVGQKISLPNNTFTSLTPEIAFFWAF